MTNTHDMGQAVTRSMERAGHSLSDAAAPSLKAITGVAHQASDAISHTGKQLRDAQLSMAKSGRGYVREKPLTSLGIGIGIGVGVGLLVSYLLRER